MTTVNLLKKVAIGDGHYKAAESPVFVSAVIVGNGGSQSTAHGFGATPSLVLVALVGGPAPPYTQPVVTEGSHDGTNCVVTVTAGWSYRILALA